MGSTIYDSLCLDRELNRRLGKVATVMSRLSKWVWSSKQLTEHTKVQVYKAFVLRTLLYGTFVLHASLE